MRRKSKIAVVGAICVAGLTMGVTSGDAATRESAGPREFHACLSGRTHELTEVTYGTEASKCGAHEHSVSWSRRGPAGARGRTGAVGARGPKGAVGAVGAVGAKGDTGAQGTTGAQGETGQQGATGDTGAQGATGDRGATGQQGAQGAQGPQGPQGPQGIPGIQGQQGPVGPSDVYSASTDSVNIGASTGGTVVVSKALPTGAIYLVNVKMDAINFDTGNDARFSCDLRLNGTVVDSTSSTDDNFTDTSAMDLQAVVTVFGGLQDGTVDAVCSEPGPANDSTVENIKLAAIHVGASH